MAIKIRLLISFLDPTGDHFHYKKLSKKIWSVTLKNVSFSLEAKQPSQSWQAVKWKWHHCDPLEVFRS